MYWIVQLKHDKSSSRSSGLGAAPRTGGRPRRVGLAPVCGAGAGPPAPSLGRAASVLAAGFHTPPAPVPPRLPLHLATWEPTLVFPGAPSAPPLAPSRAVPSPSLSWCAVASPKAPNCYRPSSCRFLLVIQLDKSFSCLFGKNL